jgi:hypothetical protein
VVGGGMVAANQANVQANRARDKAAKTSQVDIDVLNDQTKAIAKQNAIDSASLERLLTPEVPKLRTAANQGLLDQLNQGMDPGVAKAKAALEGSVGVPLNTPLLNAAIAKAKSNLDLGGKLSVDQRNEATRQGAAQAGTMGGNLGLGRDLAARDLGLSSYNIERQRLMDASQLGGQEQGLATDNSTNLLNQLQALKGISDSQYNKYLSAAQYGESIAQPNVGLDPTAIANIKIGNSNNQSAVYSSKGDSAIAQGNSLMNLIGQAGGAYLAYKGSSAKTAGSTTGGGM